MKASSYLGVEIQAPLSLNATIDTTCKKMLRACWAIRTRNAGRSLLTNAVLWKMLAMSYWEYFTPCTPGFKKNIIQIDRSLRQSLRSACGIRLRSNRLALMYIMNIYPKIRLLKMCLSVYEASRAFLHNLHAQNITDPSPALRSPVSRAKTLILYAVDDECRRLFNAIDCICPIHKMLVDWRHLKEHGLCKSIWRITEKTALLISQATETENSEPRTKISAG